MRFKQRKELADKYKEWVKQPIDNNQTMILDCAESMITFLDINGYLNEVVHGEWIPSRFKTLREDGWFECSVCGVGNKLYNRGIRKSDVPYIDGKPYELKNIANYCSNCGANMDGVK